MNPKNTLKIVIFFVVITATIFPSWGLGAVIHGQTSNDIKKEKDKKVAQLEELKKKLASLEAENSKLYVQKGGLQGEIGQIENEIKKIENNIEINQLKIQELDKEKEIKELEIKTRQGALNEKLLEYYKVISQLENSRSFPSKDLSKFWTDQKYSKIIIEKERSKIDVLSERVHSISKELSKHEEEKKELAQQNEDLKKKKEELGKQLASLQYTINVNYSSSRGIKADIGKVQSDIEYLTAEQKRLEAEEAARMANSGQVTTFPVGSGEYYFSGNERDLYNGHYVGMMQWGAYDMANDGWSYTQILKRFYTGTSIGGNYATKPISVSGYGSMSIETYVSGLGEVPDKACGTSLQAIQRPDKYVVDNPNNGWDCWPEEAIKAQVVAARSYALYGYALKGKTICTSAACQVYKGGTAKKWAADETKGQAVLYGGHVANTLYSAGGCGVTMNNDDSFWSNSGGSWRPGYPVAYLRSVTYPSRSAPYCNWDWNTKGYTRDDLTSVFRSMGYDVGTFQSITYERMNGGRVRWVTLNGSTRSIKLPGWLFKSSWNNYVWNREGGRCSGDSHGCDYIYGVKFTLHSKN